ncbi:sensor histidine kinase [Chengkuizengella sp. SCS-71B]|uniref:sensor histidine kinase n=1 Tax=Chengkuizengella sp. SCS-71B TaxID=3115290 RepID=UPI0032C23706
MKNVLKGSLLFILFISLLWCLIITFRYPFIGIEVEQNEQHHWLVKTINDTGASAKFDFAVGDRILKVDDQTPDHFPTIKNSNAIEQAHEITVLTDGSVREIILDKDTIVLDDVTALLAGLICLSLAILIYVKASISKSARMLAYFFLSAAIIWFSLGAYIREDMIGTYLLKTFMMVLQIVFLHFLFVFFKEKGNITLPTKMLDYMYAIIIVVALTRLLGFFPSLSYIAIPFNSIFTLTFFTISFLINILFLSYVYLKYCKDKTHFTSIIKSVWVCLIVSFSPFILLSIIPELLTGRAIIDYIYSSLFLLLLPIFFAYLIASNQIFDIGLVLRRFLFSILLGLLPSGFFTGFYALIFYDEIAVKPILFLFLSSLVLVSWILYATEYYTTKMEKFIFPKKYYLQSMLKKVSQRLGSISSFRELKDMILVDITGTLEVFGGAILFKYKDEKIEMVYEGEININEIERLLHSPALFEHSSYTCLEINHHEEYTSYLILTRKKNNTLLGKEEIQWLKLITTYLAVSLENIHLIRKLTQKLEKFAFNLPTNQEAKEIQWFRKIMFELQEEERVRIASDLHDTTMQDLFFLKRRFVSIAEKYVMSSEDKKQLDSMIEFIEMINVNLRQSCFELSPYLLKDIGLIKTIQTMLDKEEYNCEFDLFFYAESDSMIESTDLQTKTHIFRIIQELLNNAKKHSKATRVIFSLSVRDYFINLKYEDDGVGIESHFKSGKDLEYGESNGIGMEQMKGRVMLLNGTLEIDTSANYGVTINVHIPIKEIITTRT